jgi:hypothetical protein
MFDLDWSTAIVGTVQFAIGMGLYVLAQNLSRRFKGHVGKVFYWPCYVLGFIFLASAALTILWNMFGPIVLWILSLLN